MTRHFTVDDLVAASEHLARDLEREAARPFRDRYFPQPVPPLMVPDNERPWHWYILAVAVHDPAPPPTLDDLSTRGVPSNWAPALPPETPGPEREPGGRG